jgi:SAM-dependent methyltransferase
MSYHPDPYWSEVAEQIRQRGKKNFLAGDDSPFFRYKRAKFLSLFTQLPFSNKIVMEVGSGPGGNLNELTQKDIKKIYAVDISASMIELAKANLSDHPNFNKIEFVHINGQEIPLPDRSIELAYTVTVLQHNTNEQMLKRLIDEICRVSAKDIVIFERIDSKIKGNELCYGRPIEYYSSLFSSNGFTLQRSAFLNIRISHFVCTAISKIFNKPGRKEGEPLSGLSVTLQKIALLITRPLDKVLKDRREVAMLWFSR